MAPRTMLIGEKNKKSAVNKSLPSNHAKRDRIQNIEKRNEAINNFKPKPRTKRVDRILKNMEPQLVENTKRALIMKGKATSQVICNVLTDLAKLLKPNCKMLSRKNDILAFEDVNSIEFLGQKNDCSLFAIGSHSKKRPHNLILGRSFDGHVLDMYEFGVEEYIGIDEIQGRKKAMGSKPMMIFQGDQWESDSNFKKIQNLLLDFFRGDKPERICLKGVDHVISCTVSEGKVFIRGYSTQFKKSGSKIPNVQLTSMGPNMDLTVRRTQLASEDMWKTACKKPKIANITKVKNITRTIIGEKIGRLHMEKQNLDKMGGKRSTALRDIERPMSNPTRGDKKRSAVEDAAAEFAQDNKVPMKISRYAEDV